MKYLNLYLNLYLNIILLLAFSQVAAAEEIYAVEHAIKLHILDEDELYVFEAISYASVNESFEGAVKIWIWIPSDAFNLSISEDVLDFEMQDSLVGCEIFIPKMNITTIYLNYELKVKPEGFWEKQFTYEIETQNPINSLFIIIISQPSYNIAASDNLEILMPTRFSEQYKVYITALANEAPLAGKQKIWIKFDLIKFQYIYYIAIASCAAIAVMVVWKLKETSKKKEDVEYQALIATLQETEKDYRSGELTEEEYKKLKSEFETRLKNRK